MGRPTKLTPELHAEIIKLVETGVHPFVAAGCFGVAQGTFYEWMARGEGRDTDRPMEPEYAAFAVAVHTAERRAEAALVALAVAKAKGSGDALAVLARRFGDRWREKIDVRVELEAEVRRIAEESGVDYAEALAEAERVLAGSSR
jgi:pyocin large subunit-like protein